MLPVLLLIDGTHKEGEEFLLYSFPRPSCHWNDTPVPHNRSSLTSNSDKWLRSIVAIKGLLSSLDGMAQAVSGQCLTGATVVTKASDSGRAAFKCSSVALDRCSLVLLMPAWLSDRLVMHSARAIARYMQFCLGSVSVDLFKLAGADKALDSDDNDNDNDNDNEFKHDRVPNSDGETQRRGAVLHKHQQLDCLFRALFEPLRCCASASTVGVSANLMKTLWLNALAQSVHCVPWWLMSDAVKKRIAIHLSTLHGSRRSTSSGGHGKAFSVLSGSALFHSGRCAASAMRPKLLANVVQFLRSRKLLLRRASDAMRESSWIVHPSPHSVGTCRRLARQQYALLVVCINEDVLAVLLKFRSGPAAVDGELDPFFAAHARKALVSIQKERLTQCLDELCDDLAAANASHLSGFRGPQDYDWDKQHARSARQVRRKTHKTALLTLSRELERTHSRQENSRQENSRQEDSRETSNARVEAEQVWHRACRCGPEPGHYLERIRLEAEADPSSGGLQALRAAPGTQSLAQGPYSVVLHYFAMDSFQGMIVSDSHSNSSNDSLAGHVHAQFLLTCFRMEDMFEMTALCSHTGTSSDADSSGPTSAKARLYRSHPGLAELGVVRELRVRIVSTQRSKFDCIAYWVAGRSYVHTTTYVCYHESVPQRSIDAAFRLALSMSRV